MTYDEDYRAALRVQQAIVFSMAVMPFKAILRTVLDLDAAELRRVITVGLVALRHLEIAQWRRLLVATLATQPSTGEPDPLEEDRRTALAVLLAAKTLGDKSD
jgi:hypothetical protein